jgi:SAM-dependent methyltransferase
VGAATPWCTSTTGTDGVGARACRARPEAARAKYRHLAPGYDRRLSTTRLLHRRAVDLLVPKPGETIADLGCGTGLSFAAIEEGIGPHGRLVGVELSAEMLARARERVADHRWRNVELIEGDVADADLPPLDPALFVPHDLMRSPRALDRVLAALKPGGRIVAAASKCAPRWLAPLNAYVWPKARHYVTTFDGFDAPWSLLAERLPKLQVESVLLGTCYLARGELPTA